MVLRKYHDMKMFHTIPRKFKPQKVMTTIQPNSTLTTDFEQKYERLFFEHLDKIITSDNITLELTNAAIQNIMAQTETYLASLQAPPQTVTQLYQTFLANNHITDREPLPILQKKLTTNSPTAATNPPTQPTLSVSLQPPASSSDSQPVHNRKRKRKGKLKYQQPPARNRKCRSIFYPKAQPHPQHLHDHS